MKSPLTMDQKWAIVQKHYETAYKHPTTNARIRFRERLTDKQIDYLYDQLMQLRSSHGRYEDRKRLLEKVIQFKARDLSPY